ncbi:MAG: Zn-dependent protease [Paucimonas sp.]|nr:Zn-dependent protease [Paucimonas sp.]
MAVYALPILFAITLHEAAHAYAAKYFGDTTAYSLGRMSLNPARHIDPVGTLLIPIVVYAATAGNFFFGYAKPVPVEFGNLRNPKRDMAWVALAGPMANFVMAFMWQVFYLILYASQVCEPFFLQMAGAGVFANLLMFALNLLPVPPLDGGRVMVSLLPHRLAYRFAQLEPYGFFIVIILLVTKLLHIWMAPVMGAAGVAVQFIASPFKYLLF